MMNKLERFQAFTLFEAVDRIPRYASYTAALRERMVAELGEEVAGGFDMDRGEGVNLIPPDDYESPDYSMYFPDHEDGENGFNIDGNGCGHLSAGFYHITERISPLRNAETFAEIESYPYPSNEGWVDDHMVAAREAAHAAGNYAGGRAGPHMYESAWQVRGYEPFLMDLLTQRDWAEFILDKFCENNLRSAVAVAKAGCDCLTTGDDVANQNAMMFQPDLWREVMKPRWAKVYAAARAIKPDIQIWYHSDGNISDVIDDLVEIGVTILNPVQPECLDPVAIRKRYGKNLAFDGCVGTQTTFPFGTPETMRGTVRRLAEDLDGLGGGLKLGPTHILQPEVPPANIVAFFDACDEITASA